MSNNNSQHFFLRLQPNDAPQAGRGAPVGVIAFKFDPANPKVVHVAGSMVSRKDTFVRDAGVAKAYGRLSSDETHVSMPIDQFKATPIDEIAATIGLHPSYNVNTNHFRAVDWKKANITKTSAIDSLEARLAQSPA